MTHKIFIGEAYLAADFIVSKLRAAHPSLRFFVLENGRRIEARGESLPVLELERAAERLMDEFFDDLSKPPTCPCCGKPSDGLPCADCSDEDGARPEGGPGE